MGLNIVSEQIMLPDDLSDGGGGVTGYAGGSVTGGGSPDLFDMTMYAAKLLSELFAGVVKYNPLSLIIKEFLGGKKPTEAILVFPLGGWETIGAELLESLGLVTGVYKNLDDAVRFLNDLKSEGVVLKKLMIGSHGNAGKLLVTQSKDDKEVSEFQTQFLKAVKEVVDSNTKVYFTACHGANKLQTLIETSNYLGCECLACTGINYGGFECEGENFSCSPSRVKKYSWEDYKNSNRQGASYKEYLKLSRDSYVKQGACKPTKEMYPQSWAQIFNI